jgi:4-amino-4-deoxy-L-arabinose transferase-like glycosyltransferase
MEPIEFSRPVKSPGSSLTNSATADGEFNPSESRVADGESRWRKFAWLVIGLAVILFFSRLGARALWSSEFRWAEVAREMRLTANYFWPTINGSPYFAKPLGTYWMVVAATWLTGGMNEAAARLPCAIAGTLAVTLLILIGQRLYDIKTGVVAGLVLATSFSFVFFSRTASADVETVAGELAALLLFLRHERRQNGWWVIALWIVMALTSQMKGLLGFALPLVVIGSYCTFADGWTALGRALGSGPLRQRLFWIVDHNRWFFNWKSPLAIVVAGAIYCVPFAISNLETGSAEGLSMVYRQNILRYFEPFDHRGPIYLYTYVIFALTAPWSVMLPAALVSIHFSRRPGSIKERSDRFTLVFFWATFVFFTLSGSRRSYYLLPILPAVGILVARLLHRPFCQMTDLARALTKIGFGVIVCATTLSVLAFAPPQMFLPEPYAQLPPTPSLDIFAIFWLGSIGTIIYAVRGLTPNRILIALGTIAWLFMFYLFIFAMPASDAYRSEKPFAAEARALVGDDASGLALFRNQGPVFYLGYPQPVSRYDKLRELIDAVDNHKVQWLIVRRRDLALLKFKNEVAAAETIYPWDSKKHNRKSMVLLRVNPTPM